MNVLSSSIDINSILNDLKNVKNHKNHKGVFGNINIPLDIFNNISNNLEVDSKPETIYEVIKISLYDSFKGCKLPIKIKRWISENNKKIEQEETIYVDIPKGIDNNEIITIKDKGNRLSSINRGDIEIKVNIEKDNYFERNGIDLIYKKTISLKESLCGFNFDITYIDGREFKIKNEKGNIIPPNFHKTISNLGMTRDNLTGDLIIIFDIIYPKTFTNDQIKELEKIL